MAELSIREINDHILGGRIRVPAFQRGFVWDADLVAYLMDSLYRDYPIGSVLLWRTREQLKVERRLGPFRLPDRDADYPIDYVLDGQQRLTSVFGVFQTELAQPPADEWTPVYFDYRASVAAQESQFVALPPDEVDLSRHFALSTLFDSVAYRAATREFGVDVARTVDEMQARFKEVKVPVEVFETEDRARVAIVFERVNRLGVALDTFQLISAWTWSEDFDLQERFRILSEEVEPYGFSAVGEDTNLLLRCCAAVVSGDASPTSLVSLNGAEVRERFTEIESGVMGAIDFLRQNLEIYSLSNIPYSALLVPLAVFFASPAGHGINMSASQRESIERWFWRSCFGRRYSSSVDRSMKTDIEAMRDLKLGREDRLGQFAVAIDPSYFLESKFLASSVSTKTFVLMLAQSGPLSWVSGQPVTLGEVLRSYNRREFHHVYPRKFLRDLGEDEGRINSLVNFVFLSAQDNKTLGGDAPSIYRAKMPAERIGQIASRSLVSPDVVFADDYEAFRIARAEVLAARARELMGTNV